MNENIRTFLTFTNSLVIVGSKPKYVKVSTDYNGGFEFLASISIGRYTSVISEHNKIVSSEKTEEEKLRELQKLWISVDEKISGYLFGDLPENNPPAKPPLKIV